MTSEICIDAIRENNGIILFSNITKYHRALRTMGFDIKKPAHVSVQVYSYRGIPIRYINKNESEK